MASCVDHLCLWKNQLDQADMEKVIGHLVDEIRRGSSVGACIFDELLTKLRKSLSR